MLRERLAQGTTGAQARVPRTLWVKKPGKQLQKITSTVYSLIRSVRQDLEGLGAVHAEGCLEWDPQKSFRQGGDSISLQEDQAEVPDSELGQA